MRVLGIARLGSFIKLVPNPATVGILPATA